MENFEILLKWLLIILVSLEVVQDLSVAVHSFMLGSLLRSDLRGIVRRW